MGATRKDHMTNPLTDHDMYDADNAAEYLADDPDIDLTCEGPCKRLITQGTDDGWCWECVSDAEERTGKEYAELRIFIGPKGMTRRFERMDGTIVPDDKALVLGQDSLITLAGLLREDK